MIPSIRGCRSDPLEARRDGNVKERTPWALRFEAIKQRQARLIERGMSAELDLLDLAEWLEIADDDSQSPDDLLAAMERHLDRCESLLLK